MAPSTCEAPTTERSVEEPRRTAAKMPTVTPMIRKTTAAISARTTVFGKREKSSSLTERRVTKENPRQGALHWTVSPA